jgi:hypothetical protein
MVFCEPVIVVQISNIAAIRGKAQDRSQGPTKVVRMYSAVLNRGREAWIESRNTNMRGTGREHSINQRRTAKSIVNADKKVDPTGQVLHKHRSDRTFDRWTQHGLQYHGDLRLLLAIVERGRLPFLPYGFDQRAQHRLNLRIVPEDPKNALISLYHLAAFG